MKTNQVVKPGLVVFWAPLMGRYGTCEVVNVRRTGGLEVRDHESQQIISCGAGSVAVPTFAFCESSLAGPTSRLHIRRVNPDIGLMLGGGIDSGPLCGRDWPLGGWDIPEEVKLSDIPADVCYECAVAATGKRP